MIESDEINYYLKESEKALKIINANATIKWTNLDFQIALAERLGYKQEESNAIANHQLSFKEMLALLQDSDFEKPHEIAMVKFDTSILPEGVKSRIDEKQIKVRGEIWRIHKYDKDQCPSNPHGHNVENGYKLHLGNGELFDNNCNSLNKMIKKKHLIKFRQELKGWKLPKLTV